MRTDAAIDAWCAACIGIADVPGLARLRYTTSHPRDMSDDLIAAHRDLASLMPQLHLPVQSGSDRILAAMNRRHTQRRLSRHHRAVARGMSRHGLHVGLHRPVYFRAKPTTDFLRTTLCI